MGTILAVDDDSGILLVVRTALEESGHHVLTTTRPDKALQLFGDHSVDVVILDVMMPGTTGFQLLENLRTQQRGRTLPILFLSSLDDPDDRVRGLRAGADDYMIKPFAPSELVARIDRMVAKNNEQLALSGRLDTFSTVDVLQNLCQGRKSGVLELWGTTLSGAIELQQGSIAAATADELQGKDAVLALFELATGHFHFNPGSHLDASSQDTLSLNSLLLEAAWLEDELERHQAFLPPLDRPLRVTTETPSVPSQELADLPFAEIHRVLAATPDIDLGGLLARSAAARPRTLLTVAVMVETGSIETELDDQPRAQTPLPARPTAGDATAHVVLLFEPPSWSQILELVESASAELLSANRQRLMAQLRSRGSGSVRLVYRGSSILLHLQPLRDSQRLPGGTLLTLASRIVIWHLSSTASQGVVKRYLERVGNRTPGLILTHQERISATEDLLKRSNLESWQASTELPATIADLLGLAEA